MAKDGKIKAMCKNIHVWFPSYIKQSLRRCISSRAIKSAVHVMFACVDHFEPDWKQADQETQRRRVQRWVADYPKLALKHKDADGCSPRHSFFYPAEIYNKEHLDSLKKICNEGTGEVDIHLHHDNDTEESLRVILEKAKNDFSGHGFLGRRPLSDQIRFAFVHGNWALNNSRPDGRWCGVNNETHVLSDAGCYADFTFPSAPSETQPQKINSIYYCRSSRVKPKAHDRGIDARVGQSNKGDLLIIQGPLTLNWRRRKFGIFPRIENAEISGTNPPTEDRVDLWAREMIHVEDKNDWIFIKVHTHGAPENNANVLLGEPMEQMYRYLESKYNDGKNFILHYVSAREMYNIIKAAEAGETGNPNKYRDYLIEKNKMS